MDKIDEFLASLPAIKVGFLVYRESGRKACGGDVLFRRAKTGEVITYVRWPYQGIKRIEDLTIMDMN
jgi:hypothetical protein